MRSVYLDYNATTPVAPSVAEAIQPFLSEHYGNPSSSHLLGQATHQAVEESRRSVANLLGADPEEIVFTSGGTESSNLAIKGICLADEVRQSGGHIITTAIEHPATTMPVSFLERLGFEVSICPCDSRGIVSPESIAELFRGDTRIVSVMHANNETGAIQPISEIAAKCREREIPFHTDAAQTIGKVTATVDALGADLISIAGHKFYAPKGIGALYVRHGLKLEPLLHGAGHESGRRASTESVPLIVGLGKAADLASRSTDDDHARLSELTARLLSRLRNEIPDLTVHGEGAQRLPNTLAVNFPKVAGHELLRQTPELFASTRSACHSGETSIPTTLAAMGLGEDQAKGTVRLSLGWPTSTEEIDLASDLLCEAWRRLTT